MNKFVSQLYEDESKQMRPSGIFIIFLFDNLETKEKREIIPESAEKPSDEHPICKINLGKLNLDSTISKIS